MTSEDFGFHVGDRVRFTGDMSSPDLSRWGKARYEYCGMSEDYEFETGREGTVCGNKCPDFIAHDGSDDTLWGIPVLFDGFRFGHSCSGQVENIDPDNFDGGWFMDPVFLEKIEEDGITPIKTESLDAFLSGII